MADVYTKVQEVLVEALGLEEDEVERDSTLIGDLGAESIDFLDIVFRLEKAFDIKIPRGELFPENIAAADSGFVEDGKVTDTGISELRERLPYADVDAFAEDPQVEHISNLFTVDMICKYLDSKLG